jgi:hypothetical protein
LRYSGKTLGDVLSGTLNYVAQAREQKLLLDINLPEAAAYPAGMKGPDWIATDTEYFIAAWNTSRVKKGDEPRTFEDFGDPNGLTGSAPNRGIFRSSWVWRSTSIRATKR